MSRNIFVFFPPGLGGNHVTNMISTDSQFASRRSVDDYKNIVNNAHNPDIVNNTNMHLLDKNSSNVVCGHFGSYMWYLDSLQRFTNPQALILKLPEDTTSKAYARLKQFQDYDSFSDIYLYSEQVTLYTTMGIQRMFGIYDCFEIDASALIFNRSINGFLEFAKYDMGLELNWSDCKKMHSNWYKRIVV